MQECTAIQPGLAKQEQCRHEVRTQSAVIMQALVSKRDRRKETGKTHRLGATYANTIPPRKTNWSKSVDEEKSPAEWVKRFKSFEVEGREAVTAKAEYGIWVSRMHVECNDDNVRE